MELNTQQRSTRRTIAFRVAEIANDMSLAPDKDVIIGVAELTRKYLETLSDDLDAFSEHAKRKTWNAADVILAHRRNPAMVRKLKDKADELRDSAPKPKKRKKAASARPPTPPDPSSPQVDLDDEHDNFD